LPPHPRGLIAERPRGAKRIGHERDALVDSVGRISE